MFADYHDIKLYRTIRSVLCLYIWYKCIYLIGLNIAWLVGYYLLMCDPVCEKGSYSLSRQVW